VPFSMLAFLIAAGCSSSSNTKPSDTNTEPTVAPGVALRPEFAYGKDETQQTGTAFAVRTKAGRKYLVTAAHLYRDDEWPTMRTITLRTMEGQLVDRCEGAPLYVGKYTEDSPHSKAPNQDFSEDLMITPLPENSAAQPLRLAAAGPNRGDTVWAVGCEA